jgi:hypothetical protein
LNGLPLLVSTCTDRMVQARLVCQECFSIQNRTHQLSMLHQMRVIFFWLTGLLNQLAKKARSLNTLEWLEILSVTSDQHLLLRDRLTTKT